MHRRSACFALSTSVLFLSGWVESGAVGRVKRVGVLDLDTENPEAQAAFKEFVSELARRGYVNSKNIVFERRATVPENQALARALASELVRAQVDVIYVIGGTYGALLAKSATSSIPIVFHNSGDPVRRGVVASLAKPGGNVTGVATLYGDQMVKSLQYLAEATKKLTSFAYFTNSKIRSLPTFAGLVADASSAGAALGISVQFVDVESFEEFEPAIQKLAKAGVHGVDLWWYMGLSGRGEAEAVASMLVRHRLSSIGAPDKGFLLELSIPAGYEARTAARLVDRILQGAKPEDLPVEQANVWDLTINMKTAKALGLDIPRSVLLRATKVLS